MKIMYRFLFFLFALGILVISCTVNRQVRTGMQAYEVKQYARAVILFTEEYAAARSAETRAQVAFFTGESSLILGDPVAAAMWFGRADADGFGNEAKVWQAEALKRAEDYAGAIDILETLVKANPATASYRSALTATRQAQTWAGMPNPQVVVRPVDWNTSAAEYMAVPMARDEVLFTSDRGDPKETYWWTGRAFANLYSCNTVSGRISPYSDKLQSLGNEGAGVMRPDGKLFVFTRCEGKNTSDARCRLMACQREGDRWSEPEAISFQNEDVNYGHPAFAANGTTLIFASDASGGFGGHDLYFTRSDGGSGWQFPVNLGPRVNSAADEQFPTVFRDTLFFSSGRASGLGGLDIFKTYVVDDGGTWASPINLGAPINSGGDDFGYVVDTLSPLPEGTRWQGYFTSSRGGISTGDDIYTFQWLGQTPEPIVADTSSGSAVPEVVRPRPQLFLSLRVMEPLYEIKDDPNSRLVGKRELPNGPVIMTRDLTDERFVTDKLGQVLLALDWDEEYTFTARYRDHLAETYELNTGEIVPDSGKSVITVNHLFVLEPIFRDKEIVLENIFYDYDQWAIREDAKPSLNKLGVILKNNPTIRILLSSYTDCRGTEAYNLELSRKRAEAAVQYLTSLGIPARRMESRGLGESMPVINCPCEACTEDQHQVNRRTTFKVID